MASSVIKVQQPKYTALGVGQQSPFKPMHSTCALHSFGRSAVAGGDGGGGEKGGVFDGNGGDGDGGGSDGSGSDGGGSEAVDAEQQCK